MNIVIDAPLFIDTHLHLDLYETPHSVLEEAARSNTGLVAVTNAPFLFQRAKELCNPYPFAWASLGMHPELVSQFGDQLGLFEDLLDFTPFVGEIGLDYSAQDQRQRRMQKSVFERILSVCAGKGNKILSVHSRNAADAVIELIGCRYPNVVIMHWYSGSLSDLETGLANGLYFSVNSAMIASKKGIEAIERIPLETMLLETDGPFVKHRRNALISGALRHTADGIAQIKKKDSDEVVAQVRSNAHGIFERVGFGQRP